MTTIWQTAGALARGVWRKTSAWRRSSLLTPGRSPLIVSPEAVSAVRQTIESIPPDDEHGVQQVAAPKDAEAEDWTKRINRETAIWNQNNVTRTQAYWNVYRAFPELHWALLAHMVSRNGGWSMTDLKGEWLPKLLSVDAAITHFEMLETCNAFIFQDAYPQLRLYAESRRTGASLFRLLPAFGVSAFIKPIWERFWEMGMTKASNKGAPEDEEERSESALLTTALIINEQNVIEEPVVQNPYFRDHVLDSASFQAQPLLQTNQIVFPMLAQGRRAGQQPKLAGKVLERFADLNERIAFGKCLYGMLFGYPLVHEQVALFAQERPHTGSRADYWPQRFYAASHNAGGLGDGATVLRWYSPTLTNAWPDHPLPNVPRRDWFRDERRLDAYSHLTSPKPPLVFDMTQEHLLGQRKLQAATQLAGNE